MITYTEHLQLIRSECERLLAIAKKRTPGEWGVYEHRATWTSFLIRGGKQNNQLAQVFNWQDVGFDINSEHNATYIAACAGRAEAGWRTTIAAIDKLAFDQSGNAATIEIIRAAWPIELLTTKQP